MLLVTFHGGSTGQNQVFAYHAKTGALKSAEALAPPVSGTLSELRSMALANGFLYVASGGKSSSTVFCYQQQTEAEADAPLFGFVSAVIGSTMSGKDFATSISHPFGIAFSGDAVCYVSNQDTNVVARVGLAGETGSLGSGCQSAYLTQQFPSASFLDGTFVASQQGALPDVALIAPDVPAAQGGLAVQLGPKSSESSPDEDGDAAAGDAHKQKLKVLNSVRDVLLANGILFVCDEVGQVVTMYNPDDGTFLGSATFGGRPTHLAVYDGGLFVSAETSLFWGLLPTAPGGGLELAQISLTPPQTNGKTNTIGGIGFDSASATAYVPFQCGTGTTGTGSIWSYSVGQPVGGKPPALIAAASPLVADLPDTPEFVLHL